MRTAALTIALLASTATPALSSQSWLLIQPGMQVSDRWMDWQAICSEQLVLTDFEGEENYLTCVMDNGDAATANVAPDGTIWWASYQDGSGQSRDSFIARVLGELDIDTPGVECLVYGDPAECWGIGSLEVSIGPEARAGYWIVGMEDRTIFDPDDAD